MAIPARPVMAGGFLASGALADAGGFSFRRTVGVCERFAHACVGPGMTARAVITRSVRALFVGAGHARPGPPVRGRFVCGLAIFVETARAAGRAVAVDRSSFGPGADRGAGFSAAEVGGTPTTIAAAFAAAAGGDACATHRQGHSSLTTPNCGPS